MPKTEPITELLERGVEEVILRKNLEEKLRSGSKLRVKLGIDPTAPNLHIGHLIPLLKLQAFQNLGHTIVFIIGDFTAMIGDPSGQSELRKPLTRDETRKNAEDYLKQAGAVIDVKKFEVHENSEWLAELGVAGMLKLASSVTVQRALERDDFQKRLKANRDISLPEMMYPLMQGYDSVAIKADVEIGGTDQKFNLLMGRRVQRCYKVPEQNIMTLSLIEGTDGVKKMSKSYANDIAIKDAPEQMYGKIMSIPDDLMFKYYRALTKIPMLEINEMVQNFQTDRMHFPSRDAKMRLAKSIVALCHGTSASLKAEEFFVKSIQKGEAPEDLKITHVEAKKYGIADLLVEVKLASSKSEARRKIEEGAVKIDGEKITEVKKMVNVSKKPMVIKLGRKFAKVAE